MLYILTATWELGIGNWELGVWDLVGNEEIGGWVGGCVDGVVAWTRWNET